MDTPEPRGRSLYVRLDGATWEALRLLADTERRQARDQALMFIVEGLAASGLLRVVRPPEKVAR